MDSRQWGVGIHQPTHQHLNTYVGACLRSVLWISGLIDQEDLRNLAREENRQFFDLKQEPLTENPVFVTPVLHSSTIMAAAVQEHRVQPYSARGEEGKDEITQLSDLDHLMPKLYVHMIEVFELPADANKDAIINNLLQGLARTLDDYPIVAGTLHFDNEARRIVVKKQHGSAVSLYVKTAEVDDIPAFSFLDEKDFPVHLLDASKVLPPAFAGQFPVPGQDTSATGTPALALQVTFIEGGLILALAVSHQVCDGPGCEAFLDALSRHSAAATQGTVYVSPTPIPNRSILRATSKPSPSTWEKLGPQYPTFKAPDTPSPPPPADAKPPAVKTRIWHIPLRNLQKLKAEAKTEGAGVSSFLRLFSLLRRHSLMLKAT